MSETSDTDAKPIPPLSEWEMLSALRIQLEVEIFQTNKVTLFSALERAGVTKIVITFDGYGDSGQIEDVQAKAGDDVTEGQELLVMEAMKMELSLKAPRAGKVEAVQAAAGDFVEADAVLVKLAAS